jgi:hypothetical protein
MIEILVNYSPVRLTFYSSTTVPKFTRKHATFSNGCNIAKDIQLNSSDVIFLNGIVSVSYIIYINALEKLAI